jgi:hypothetical protein
MRAYLIRVFKRGVSPSFLFLPLSFQERGTKGVRL